MPVKVEVAADAAGWETISGLNDAILNSLQTASDEFGFSNAGFSVLLTGDEQMRALNKNWRSADKPTNVLSFPAAQTPLQADGFLGDIALAYETIIREAADEMKKPLHHVTHLTVHAALHLFGLDHQDAAEAQAMEAREQKILARLGIPDPYAAGDQRLAESK